MEDFPYPLPMLLDGATGTALLSAGMPADVCRPGGLGMEQWVLQHPQMLQTLLNAYIDAGSQAVFAPTCLHGRNRRSGKGLRSRPYHALCDHTGQPVP